MALSKSRGQTFLKPSQKFGIAFDSLFSYIFVIVVCSGKATRTMRGLTRHRRDSRDYTVNLEAATFWGALSTLFIRSTVLA